MSNKPFEIETLRFLDGSVQTQAYTGQGAGAIADTRRGFIDLVGDKPNNENDCWFEAVTVHGDSAYVVGSDQYINETNDCAKIYKFDLITGEQVWVNQINAGRGAVLNFLVADGVITIDAILNPGAGYTVGDIMRFDGGIFEANGDKNFAVRVDSVTGDGSVITASIVAGYDATGISGSGNGYADNNGAAGDVISITYNETTNRLLVAQEYRSGQGDANNSSWTWTNIYTVNPGTGAVESATTLTGQGDVYGNTVKAYNADKIAVVGEKYGEYQNFGVLDIIRGGSGYFDILRTNLSSDVVLDNYYNIWVSGTGINSQQNLNSVNVYNGLTTTVREGSGAVFTVIDNGNGTYSAVISSSAGADYLAGHKIKVLGTDLGGATPANDLIISVTSVGGSGGISTFDVSGTAASTVTNTVTGLGTNGSANQLIITIANYPDITLVQPGWRIDGPGIVDGRVNTVSVYNTDYYVIDTGDRAITAGELYTFTLKYTAVTGTNYQIGTGAVPIVYVDLATGAFSWYGLDSGGTNYVVGDVLTILGTSFANGTTPANDATMTVSNRNSNTGAVTYLLNGAILGSAPTDAVRLGVSGVDFGVTGSWSLKQNLNNQAFVWTPAWSATQGGAGTDRFYDTAWSTDGSAVYAVGISYSGVYTRAMVAKFDATTGAVVWNKDIKFSGAETADREAHAVLAVPGSTDILVAGAWHNGVINQDEIILTRIASDGTAVWQKAYASEDGFGINYEMSLSSLGDDVVLNVEYYANNSSGLAYFVIAASDGALTRNRIVTAPNNSIYNYYNTPTAQWGSVYQAGNVDYSIMVGYTYVPTDDYYNAVLIKMPINGYKDFNYNLSVSIGEFSLNNYLWNPNTLTSAFENITVNGDANTIVDVASDKTYTSNSPAGQLEVFTTVLTDDSAGYLAFGDGSKQSFATDTIPQIPAVNDYYITAQDSGKHIFFESGSGTVYIPSYQQMTLPVGFTFTIVNTSGNNCYAECYVNAPVDAGLMKLAGRNIQTRYIGIPDSGSGSMVTFLKVKTGYHMLNSAGPGEYYDVWMVSGPGDVYNDD